MLEINGASVMHRAFIPRSVETALMMIVTLRSMKPAPIAKMAIPDHVEMSSARAWRPVMSGHGEIVRQRPRTMRSVMRQITTAMASSMKKRSEAVITPAEVGSRPAQWAIGQPAQHLRTARVLMLKASTVKSVVGAEYVSENAEVVCGPSGVLAMRLKPSAYPERKNVVPVARVGRKHAAAQQSVAGVTGNRALMKASVSLEQPARPDKPNA